MPTLISPGYSSLSTEVLQANRALTEQKMLTLISNAAWLEEGYTARPYNGAGAAIVNSIAFNHCGGGGGAYLRCAYTLPRGIIRDPDDMEEALAVSNSDDFMPVPMLQWSFEAAPDYGVKNGGANWRVCRSVPFLLHQYAAMLRWRVAFKRSSGEGSLHLRLAVYERPQADAADRIAWSHAYSFANNAWEAHELLLDLDSETELKRRRCKSFPGLWHATLLARVDAGTEFLVGDNMNGLATWPGMAVCTP